MWGTELYIEVTIQCHHSLFEVVCAELTQVHYESFWEEESGLKAYIKETLFDKERLQNLLIKYAIPADQVHVKELEEKNWNEEWEKNFKPVWIGGICRIRAPFHEPAPEAVYDILIEPKMSFGTGHHDTTCGVITHLLKIPLAGKKVMDVGCGTGILGILAHKMGACKILAFDVEPWAYENCKENILLNQCTNIIVKQGDISQCVEPTERFEVIIANITKNVLVEESRCYMRHLCEGGILIVSGFYEMDIPEIAEAFSPLVVSEKYVKNEWATVVFKQS